MRILMTAGIALALTACGDAKPPAAPTVETSTAEAGAGQRQGRRRGGVGEIRSVEQHPPGGREDGFWSRIRGARIRPGRWRVAQTI